MLPINHRNRCTGLLQSNYSEDSSIEGDSKLFAATVAVGVTKTLFVVISLFLSTE